MNAPGKKLVDDFDAPELAPVRQAFLDGAHFIYGHTVMQRAVGLGYQSEWARRICRRWPSATRFTRLWVTGCRLETPDWLVLRGSDATTPAAILNAI